jgi:hypothetical protein
VEEVEVEVEENEEEEINIIDEVEQRAPKVSRELKN